MAGRLSDKEEGEIPVAVSVSGEEDVSERSLAWRLAERLADRKDGMFDFISVRMKPRYGMRWRPEELSADM